MGTITEKTLVPISLIVLIVGGVAFLMTTSGRVEANTQRILRIEDAQKTYNEHVMKIYQEISEIKGELKNRPEPRRR